MHIRHLRLAGVTLAAMLALTSAAVADTPVAPGWTSGLAAISVSRTAATATLLDDGKVLLAGGHQFVIGTTVFASSELYNPQTNTWAATGAMKTARFDAAAVRLADGRVLVLGGTTTGGTALASAELYDPETGKWSDAHAMLSARDLPAAVLLPSGKVFVAGGAGKTAELYDPATDTWAAAAAMTVSRLHPAAALLADGRVLVAGGNDGTGAVASTEVYTPTTNTWAAPTNMSTERDRPTLTTLTSGKVLVAGGGALGGASLASAERFDPATRAWSSANAMTNQHGAGAAATRLPNGRVLVTGGQIADNGAPGSDVYDPATNTWASGGTQTGTRFFHTSTLLPSGQVLLAGSVANSGLSTSLFTVPTTLTGENLALGDQTVATTRAPTTVHVTNTGDSPLLIRNLTLGGANAGDFTPVSDGCSHAPVAPGTTCSLVVAFRPAATGTRSATIAFRANTPASPHTFTLTGAGVAPTAEPVAAAAAPPLLAPAGRAAAAARQLQATLGFTFRARLRSTKFTSLKLTNLDAGVTVLFTCSSGCAKASFTTQPRAATLSLKRLVARPLKPGTKLTVTVTRPGALAITKTLVIRARRAPKVATKLRD